MNCAEYCMVCDAFASCAVPLAPQRFTMPARCSRISCARPNVSSSQDTKQTKFSRIAKASASVASKIASGASTGWKSLTVATAEISLETDSVDGDKSMSIVPLRAFFTMPSSSKYASSSADACVKYVMTTSAERTSSTAFKLATLSCFATYAPTASCPRYANVVIWLYPKSSSFTVLTKIPVQIAERLVISDGLYAQSCQIRKGLLDRRRP